MTAQGDGVSLWMGGCTCPGTRERWRLHKITTVPHATGAFTSRQLILGRVNFTLMRK